MATHIETYEQAIEYLLGRINFERSQPDAYSSNDFKLDRMRGLLEAIGSPQMRLPAIHVAGTKGKGSCCSMLASVLTTAGLRTGLFTSPHLSRFEERLRVDGRQPSPTELVELVNRLQPVVEDLDRSPARMHPTYFEITNVLAWLYFLDQRSQVAVLETGLGGRLDSTNLCQPWLTIITNVSRDHTQILGSTIRAIAAEKAGIIKTGVPVISACRHPDAIEVVVQTSRERNADLWLIDRDFRWEWCSAKRRTINVTTPRQRWEAVPVPLRGAHQAENAATVMAALDRLAPERLSLTPDALRTGLLATRWPARVEVVGKDPCVVIDAAHNWASAKALAATIESDFPARRRILVFACSSDKDYRGLIRQLAPLFDTIIFTRFVENPRAVTPEELQGHLETIFDRPAHIAGDPIAAWKLARRLAHPTDLIVITGSLFLAAELRDVVLEAVQSDAPHVPGTLAAPAPQPSRPVG